MHFKSVIGFSRCLALLSLSLFSLSSVIAADYSWRTSSQPWAFAGGWLIDGTTVSPQGGPGATDSIVTPQAGSFATIRLNGAAREINNITTDSTSTWSFAGRTSGGTPSTSSLTIYGTLTKNGTGTFTISKTNELTVNLVANNIIQGDNGGTLAFANDLSSLAVNGDIAIGTNSTFSFGAPFSLQAGKTLAGTGVINANATLSTASGAILSPGSSGVGTLTFNGGGNSGTVLDASGAVLNFDFAGSNASDRLVFNNYVVGDLVLSATLNGTGVVAGTYQLVKFYSDGGSSVATTGNLTSGLTLGTGFNGFTTSLQYAASGITLVVTDPNSPTDPEPPVTDPAPPVTDPDLPTGPDGPTVTSLSDVTWFPVAHRFKEVYDAGVIGNRGLQNQRVFTWNQGVNDPARRGWVISGQDENSVRLSKDYGATWGFPRLAGMFCASMAGLYLNTDDDVFVAVGDNTNNPGGIAGYTGLYVGDGSLLSAKRVAGLPNHPDGTTPFTSVLSGNSADRNINCIGRRPQTGNLTPAERPIIVLEQAKTSGIISAIYVWTSPDNGASWSMIRQLPIATYTNGDADGIFHVIVAPNGDVLLLGQTGVFLSQDLFATAPSKIYPASGSLTVSSGYFFGGDATNPSGARIGVYEATANGGVYETTNIRTIAFTKPNGNSGLPANYRVWHMGGSPVNPNRLAVCTDGAPPYLSTDGGRTFSVIPENPGVGESDGGRYNVRGKVAAGHAGFHFCPTDEMICVIPTGQTMARSIDGAQTSDGSLVNFFDGMHTKGFGFHPTNYKKLGRMTQDSGLNLTSDGMHWVRATGTARGTPYFATVEGTAVTTFGGGITAAGGGSENYISGSGMCFAPTGDRVIGFFNCSTGGQPNIPVIMENPTSSGVYQTLLIKDLDKSLCANSYPSPQNNNVAFVGRWAISNLAAVNAADVVFTDHSTHEIINCFLDADGTTLISYWADVKPGSATNQSGTAIYRSTADLGNTYQDTAWYTLPKVLNSNNVLVQTRYNASAICADPHQPERVLYVRSDNAEAIREIKRVGSDLVDTELVNLRTMPGGVLDTLRAELGDSGFNPPKLPITQILCDPNKSGLFYAVVGRHGTPNWWMSTDGGTTWTNISGDSPRTLWSAAVSPVTGELLGFSSMGEHVHRSPDIAGYPALDYRDAYTKQIDAYFTAWNVQPSVTTTDLPNTLTGGAYNSALVATGNDGPLVWSIVSGSLPLGLSLSADGVISGTATTEGTSTFTLKLADSDVFSGAGDEQTQTLTLTVDANSVPAITGSPASGTVGVAYNQSLAALGGNGALVWNLTSGALPAGLSLSSTGMITGTPQTSGTGSFTVQVADSDNITGSSDEDTATLSLTVNPAPTTIAISKLVQRYDGQPKAVDVSSPSGDPVTVTYNGSATPPTLPGVYDVVASVSSSTHSGTATEKLTITITAQVRHAPTITAGLNGSVQVMTGDTLSLSGGSWVTGDLLLPGTPTVTKSGGASYTSQIQGPGAATPVGYAVKLSGGAVLRNIVHHVDPLALPVIPAPAQPTGTRNVALSSPTQNAGDFATVHNLTLSGNVGSVAVPPGTYGTLTASGSSAFVLGVSGATEPAVYQLQGLTVATQLQIVGPVVLLVGGNVTVTGSGVLGSSVDPESLMILIAQGGLTASGATRVYGNVVAPNAGVSLSGSATLNGTVVSDTLSITGGALLEEPAL